MTEPCNYRVTGCLYTIVTGSESQFYLFMWSLSSINGSTGQ